MRNPRKTAADPSKFTDASKATDPSKATDAVDPDEIARVIDGIAAAFDAHPDYCDVEAVQRARVPVVSCKHTPSAVEVDVSVRNHFPV